MNLFKNINLPPQHKWLSNNINENININININKDKYKYKYNCDVMNVPLPESGILLITTLVILLLYKRSIN